MYGKNVARCASRFLYGTTIAIEFERDVSVSSSELNIVRVSGGCNMTLKMAEYCVRMYVHRDSEREVQHLNETTSRTD